LELRPTSSNRFALHSLDPVRKGNDLLLMSMGECIFSSGFTGASQAEEMQINQIVQKLSSEYESLNKDFM
jgi:hypothetical protein